MNWSVLTDPGPNLGGDARAELARLDDGARTALSQEIGTIVNRALAKMIDPWFSRGAHDWANVDVYGAGMRDGALVLHFIADHYNYNFAQSGSDWADHYLFAGEAHVVNGKRTHETFALERHLHLTEHEDAGYDRRKLIDTVRDELRAKLREAGTARTEVDEAVDGDGACSDPAREKWESLLAAGDLCHEDIELSTRALAIPEDGPRVDHPDIIAALRSLIEVCKGRRDTAGEERLIGRLLPVLERTRGLLHEDTTRLVLNLGRVLSQQQKYAEADQVYDRWLHAAEAAWGPDDPRAIKVIAAMAANCGDLVKASSLNRRVRDLTWLLPCPEGDAGQRLSLARQYSEQGRHEEAEMLLRRHLLMASPDDTTAAGALADVLRKLGCVQEAEQIESDAMTELYKRLRSD